MAFATFWLDTATVSLAFSTIVTPKRTVRLWKGAAVEEEALLFCLVLKGLFIPPFLSAGVMNPRLNEKKNRNAGESELALHLAHHHPTPHNRNLRQE